jgi:hypothetical protein
MMQACQMSENAHLYWATAVGIPLGIFALFAGIALLAWVCGRYDVHPF